MSRDRLIGFDDLDYPRADDRTGGALWRTARVRLRDRLRERLSAISFWSAIALPALYLPLLLWGIETEDGLIRFLGLFGLHLLLLIGGRGYPGTGE